jgi:hypothetical protein
MEFISIKRKKEKIYACVSLEQNKNYLRLLKRKKDLLVLKTNHKMFIKIIIFNLNVKKYQKFDCF